ncbi:hypothetical protein A134_06045 [Vibrio crassostreae 9CS106]|nr:hypothetical protein A134_06045 [Vibrio crassostreae 9CS106]
MSKAIVKAAILTSVLVLSGQLAYTQGAKWVKSTNSEYQNLLDVNHSFRLKMDQRYDECNYKLDRIPVSDPQWKIERDIAKVCTDKVTAYWKPMRMPVIEALEKGELKFKIARSLKWME